MTHSWFDYSVKLLGEKVPGVHSLTGGNSVWFFPLMECRQLREWITAWPFTWTVPWAPWPRHPSDLSQPPVKISRGEEITHTSKTLRHRVWVILFKLRKWSLQQEESYQEFFLPLHCCCIFPMSLSTVFFYVNYLAFTFPCHWVLQILTTSECKEKMVAEMSASSHMLIQLMMVFLLMATYLQDCYI